MKFLIHTLMFATLITFSASNSQAGFKLDIEGGLVSNGYNDVRIPGDIGTDISLTDDLKSDESGFWRLRLGIDLGQRHRLSFLVAPLRLNTSGVIDRNIEYNGVDLPPVVVPHFKLVLYS